MRKTFAGRLRAYTLTVGAAALATQAGPANAVMTVHDNGGAGWQDVASGWDQDTISFKMDGTVVLNTGDTGLLSLGQDDDSFTFQAIAGYMWHGTDDKSGNMLHTGANTGYVGGDSGDPVNDAWDVGRLGAGDVIGSSPSGGRSWSSHDVTDTGLMGALYGFYFYGEWGFGGSGYIGLYADSGGDRFYGWADVHTPPYTSPESYWDMTLNAFAFSDIPDMAVFAGGPEGAPGNFNGDWHMDDLDIDMLGDAIRMGSIDFDTYDISADGETYGQDGVIDIKDLDYLVRFLVEAGVGVGTEYGDFNLDGRVDTTDLTRLSTDYGAGDTWAKGNANRCVDLITDITDLTILATYYGQGPLDPDVVPEPVTLSLLALGASGLLAHRKRA